MVAPLALEPPSEMQAMTITHQTYRNARHSLVEECRKLRNWRRKEPERATFISAHLKTKQMQLADLRRWPRRAAD